MLIKAIHFMTFYLHLHKDVMNQQEALHERFSLQDQLVVFAHAAGPSHTL